MRINVTLNPHLLDHARALAAKSSLSVERYLSEVLEGEIAARRVPHGGEARHASSGDGELVPYHLRLR